MLTIAILTVTMMLPSDLAFDPAVFIPTGPMPGRPAIGDLNGDGKPDIVLACGTCCGSPAKPDSGHVLVLLGDGLGGFVRTSNGRIVVAPSVRKIALGDVNGDEHLDVVAPSTTATT